MQPYAVVGAYFNQINMSFDYNFNLYQAFKQHENKREAVNS